MVVKLNENNFNETTSTGTVLIDFYADWCGPCKRMMSTLDSVADKLKGKVTVVKVNVDESKDLAQKFKVRSIPMLVVMKDGNIIDQTLGSKTETQLLEFVGGQEVL